MKMTEWEQYMKDISSDLPSPTVELYDLHTTANRLMFLGAERTTVDELLHKTKYTLRYLEGSSSVQVSLC